MVLVHLPLDVQVIGSVHVEVLHKIQHDDETLAINSLDVNFVGVACEIRRDGRNAMLRVTSVDIVEGSNVDVDALVLYHLGGSGTGILVWVIGAEGGKSGSARRKSVRLRNWEDLLLRKNISRRR